MVLIAGSNIIVDGFTYSSRLQSQRYVFFLTHFHTDHYNGLTESWNHGAIYCSPMTKKLVIDKYPALESIITVIDLDETKWIWLDEDCQKGVNVTFLDANHCPGSVMIYFQGEFGNIFHTGDFRFIDKMLDHKIFKKTINHLYLDNTFLAKEFKFGSQDEMAEQLFATFNEFPGYNVWIAMDSLGKERLLIKIAERYNTKVTVSQERHDLLELLELDMSLFTTDREASRFHLVNRADMALIRSENFENRKTVGFVLTGWSKVKTQKGPNVFRFPYSCHSSYPELKRFLKNIKLEKLTYTVENSATNEDAERIYHKYSKPENQVSQQRVLPFQNTQPVHTLKRLNKGQGDLKIVKRPRFRGNKLRQILTHENLKMGACAFCCSEPQHETHVSTSMMISPRPRFIHFPKNSFDFQNFTVQAWRGYRIRKMIRDMMNARAEEFPEVWKLTQIDEQTVEILKKLETFKIDQSDDLKVQQRPPVIFEDNSIYIGEWSVDKNLKQGNGTMIWENQTAYKGAWKNSIANGYGVLLFSNGNFMVGNWINGIAHGKIKELGSKGAIYQGDYFIDMKHGKGSETVPGDFTYKGEYQFGQKDGQGRISWPDGTSYEGNFVNGLISGHGEFKWPDVKIYVGEWLQGQMHGYGTTTWSSGTIYEGNYQRNEKNGYGTMNYWNGKIYQGMWFNGTPQGQGKLWDCDRLIYDGQWENGKRCNK